MPDAKGNKYTLEYTKNVIIRMEAAGFDIDLMDKQPVRMITLLFHGAFQANHPELSGDEIEEIYKPLADKTGLLKKLAEMYKEQSDLIVDEGNVSWEANW